MIPNISGKVAEDQKTQGLSIAKSDYKVVLDNFEGPLDLLIHLIKKEQINIYDISITKITDQYLAFLESMKILNLDIASEFLVMAATLIYMKSQTLLTPKEPDEERNLEEQKRDLVERLLEYQKFKEITEQFSNLAEEQGKVFFRTTCQMNISEDGLSEIEAELFDLVLALRDVLQKTRAEEIFVPIEITEIDIKDKIRQILAFLRIHKNTYLEDLLEGKYERQNIIITFLALLEMVKTRVIRIQQSVPFGGVFISINYKRGDYETGCTNQ